MPRLGLHITPDMLEQGYRLLCLSPPFSAWHLPEADDVVFHAVPIKGPHKGCQGEHWFDGEHHHLRISPKRHSTYNSMLMTLAHEVVHMQESILKLRADVMHGREFQRMATAVCRNHLFDRGQF
jgi:hypothetical protein